MVTSQRPRYGFMTIGLVSGWTRSTETQARLHAARPGFTTTRNLCSACLSLGPPNSGFILHDRESLCPWLPTLLRMSVAMLSAAQAEKAALAKQAAGAGDKGQAAAETKTLSAADFAQVRLPRQLCAPSHTLSAYGLCMEHMSETELPASMGA